MFDVECEENRLGYCESVHIGEMNLLLIWLRCIRQKVFLWYFFDSFKMHCGFGKVTKHFGHYGCLGLLEENLGYLQHSVRDSEDPFFFFVYPRVNVYR